MKSSGYGTARFPVLYQSFKSADDIGRTINRSRSYVFKALKEGFTEREWQMLNAEINERKEIK